MKEDTEGRKEEKKERKCKARQNAQSESTRSLQRASDRTGQINSTPKTS